jgi:DNA modification methylase/superfamily II DNA or RNA helicase
MQQRGHGWRNRAEAAELKPIHKGSNMEYDKFLASKKTFAQDVGKDIELGDIHPTLFPFQAAITKWAVKKGRAAIFADVGLGKTIMQLEWARQIGEVTLILAPLAVAQQTVNEARKHLNMDVRYVRSQTDVKPDECRVYITNYEMLEHFDSAAFGAVILDESSLLKNYSGATKRAIITAFKNTPYKLCCTATPAPNDLLEIGNHAEFLNVMTSKQMISVFFIQNDRRDGQDFRLKRHAVDRFYEWLSSWAVALKKPSDIGDYDDTGYNLPELNLEVHYINSDYTPKGMLPGFGVGAISATDAKKVRRATIDARAAFTAPHINASSDQWIVWTALNDEADTLANLIPDSINIHGSLPIESKVSGLMAFINQDVRVLNSKVSIAGMGVNMQQCANMLFFGVDYSWEGFYQAIGRIRRFGQLAKRINVVVVTTEQERPVYQAIVDKGIEAQAMTAELIARCKVHMQQNIQGVMDVNKDYSEKDISGKDWTMWLGDSCERMHAIPSNSVDLSIYSPPFADLFIFNHSARDLSNSLSHDEFMAHMQFIIAENLRITKPGRIIAVHIQDRKQTYVRDGKRGIFPLSDELIRAYVAAGATFRARITIDKDPELVAIRTKDSDLMYGSAERNALKVAPVPPDYLLVFAKEGEADTPTKPTEHNELDFATWCKWARAIWYDVDETNVLPTRAAKGNDDERHIAPLQLGVIERAIKLWSNPGELVFSPFAGIGSEGWESLKNRRRFHGIELKKEYHDVACRNLRDAETKFGRTLFDLMKEQEVS